MYVLTGRYGKQPGIIRSFERLTNNQLKEELQARAIYNFGSTKADTRQSLNEALTGVQRVPSLLFSSPTENIQTLKLKNYTVLECEPLHDLKGHLCNVFEILPTILEKELAASCKTILDIDLFKKDTKRGADFYSQQCLTLSAGCIISAEACGEVYSLFNFSKGGDIR